mgnify:CR=1 FL=1
MARSASLVCWRQRVLDGPVQPAEAETVGEGSQSESRALTLVSVASAGEDDDRAAQISASHGSQESNRGWAGCSIGRLRRVVTPVRDDKVKRFVLARSACQCGHAILGGSDGDERLCFPLRSRCGSPQVIEGFPVVFGVRVHPEDPALLQQAPESDEWIRRLVDCAEVVVEAREVLSTLSVVAEDLNPSCFRKCF